MDAFVNRHQDSIIGVLSGCDRMRFRGTLRSIAYSEGVARFLCGVGVRYKNYKEFVLSLSKQVIDHAEQVAKQAGRPFPYLSKSSEDKRAEALRIAKRDGITEGLICIFRCVEPCRSFCIRKNDQGSFGFRSEQRKCLHLYYYHMDREFGLMHVRIATWLPFGIHVCLNGREYLAKRMEKAGMAFKQRENCFVWIEDMERAQKMLFDMESRKWERWLKILSLQVNPLMKKTSTLDIYPYYWSVSSSEYATDIMFRDDKSLVHVYPALVDHAMKQFDSKNVLRFLGRRTNTRFNGEVTTSYLVRKEGVRVKHWAEENSIKMYDKQGSVLRIETTINNVRRFKAHKMTVWNGVSGMRWIPMRHAVADLARRIEVSYAANKGYLEALSVVNDPSPARVLLDSVSRPLKRGHCRYRALRPVSLEDSLVFSVILGGEFLIKGFSNRDLRKTLVRQPLLDPLERRRASGRMTRLLRLLRAHGLIRKVSKTRYYRVTSKGHRVMTAALRLRDANITKLAG